MSVATYQSQLFQEQLHFKQSASIGVDNVVWRAEKFSIISLKKLKQNLVMVSFSPQTYTADRLRQDPNLHFYLSDPADPFGYALLEVSQPEDLDYYAGLAHTGPGFRCGNMQLLGNPLALQPESAAGPIYEEHIKLASVSALMDQVTQSEMLASITTLQDLGTRYYNTTAGLSAPATVKALFEAAIGTATGFTVAEFEHDTFDNSAGNAIQVDQDSLIVTLEGTDPSLPRVIFGAHLDSTVSGSLKQNVAPGADDDATGIATLVEMVRILAASGARFQRTIEFQAYAAEEVGLLGSKDIAETYKEQGVKIAGMFQIDMNGYSAEDGDTTIYLISTFTDSVLRQSLKDLLNNYLGGDFVEQALSAGRSDHVSFTDQGYAAVFPFEDPDNFNDQWHSTGDTTDNLNALGLTVRFAKLGLGFASHYGGLTATSSTADVAAEYTAAQATGNESLGNDLKLAVIDTATDGQVNIGVGAPEGIVRVELCVTASATTTQCKTAVTVADLVNQVGERSLFLTEQTLALADGDSLVAFGYDTSDTLTATRQVRLTLK